MTHFRTVRLVEVEGTPKDVDLEGVTQKLSGHWKKLGRWLIQNDNEALDAIDEVVIKYYVKASVQNVDMEGN